MLLRQTLQVMRASVPAAYKPKTSTGVMMRQRSGLELVLGLWLVKLGVMLKGNKLEVCDGSGKATGLSGIETYI